MPDAISQHNDMKGKDNKLCWPQVTTVQKENIVNLDTDNSPSGEAARQVP